MPGTGPPPKDPRTRQRRNKTATRSTLAPLPSDAPQPGAVREIPPLPPIRGKWAPAVEAWWRDLWSSPMAVRFPPSEVSSLVMIARLRQDFERAKNARERREASSEIRLQERRWGLDEMSRRSLQWEFSGGDEDDDRVPAVLPKDETDPRQALRVVS